MPASLPIHDAPGRPLNLWPGTPYSRNAIPIDYPASRDLRPRWGHGRPPHAALAQLFADGRPRYRRLLDERRRLSDRLSRIPPAFDEASQPRRIGWLGGATNAADLSLLYTVVAASRPRRLVEVGSGKSTHFARRAVSDLRLSTRLTVIDPRPGPEIAGLVDELIPRGLEELPDLAPLTSLEPGDILYVDGSHRSFQNSDVTVAMLDVIPQLSPGVLIHVHDIWLPHDYPPMFLHWYWNEQYLLAAYLLGARERVEILFPGQFVTTDPAGDPALLARPDFLPPTPHDEWSDFGCFWFTHK